MPEPREFPPSGAPRHGAGSRRRSIVVGIVLVAVFIVFTGLAAVAGRPPRAVPVSGAELYLAPDGDRRILTGPRSTQVRWTGHQPGSRPFLDGPPGFIAAAVEARDVTEAAWVVENEDDQRGDHAHLMRLDEDGLSTWTTTWPEEWTFVPARPEVPAQPHPGQRIDTAGTAKAVGRTVDYASSLEVLDAPQAGTQCLEFRRTDRIGDSPPTTSSRTRCPGQGVVALTLPVEAPPATATWQAVAAWPPDADPRPGLDLTPVSGRTLTGLRPAPLTFERGGLPTTLTPAGTAQVVDDVLVLPAQSTGNLTWADRGDTDGVFVPGRWAVLGGDAITSGRCGEVLVVATTQRRVLAHDLTGSWLWSTTFGDVVGSTPVRSGENLLITTKDGALHAVSCRTGAIIWTAGPVVSVQPPAVGPAGVLVAAEGGVRLLDPVTGATRWEQSVPDTVTALAQFGEAAVVGTIDNRVFVLAADSGHQLTTFRVPEAIRELHRLPEGMVARTNGLVLGLTPDEGVRWSYPFAGKDSLAGPDHVVVAGFDEVVVVDADGNELERDANLLDPSAAGLVLTRTADGYLASDLLGNIVRWRP